MMLHGVVEVGTSLGVDGTTFVSVALLGDGCTLGNGGVDVPDWGCDVACDPEVSSCG